MRARTESPDLVIPRSRGGGNAMRREKFNNLYHSTMEAGCWEVYKLGDGIFKPDTNPIPKHCNSARAYCSTNVFQRLHDIPVKSATKGGIDGGVTPVIQSAAFYTSDYKQREFRELKDPLDARAQSYAHPKDSTRNRLLEAQIARNHGGTLGEAAIEL